MNPKSARTSSLSRRDFFAVTGAAAAGTALIAPQSHAAPTPSSFRYCLNTATIRGQKLGIVKEVDTASAAGYQGIEPWISDIQQYEKAGGSLEDLRKRMEDGGIRLESAIGFAKWIVEDEVTRTAALEQARREMGMLAKLGGRRIAAPPSGATKGDVLAPEIIGERYRALLEIGREEGILPQLEVWGFSVNLHRLSQSVAAMVEADHPHACLLPDVYHLYKGGGSFRGLGMLEPSAFQVLHMNDYPADPPRESIGDKDRVLPTDGVAPFAELFDLLRARGGELVLSLEIFNPTYWAQDPLEVARLGLEKMKVASALSAH